MGKKFVRKFKKYNFIIVFGASFVIFMGSMGVSALSQMREVSPSEDRQVQASSDERVTHAEQIQGSAGTEQISAATENRTEAATTSAPNQTQNAQTDETTESSQTVGKEEATGANTAPNLQQDTQKTAFTTADASYLDGALFIGDSRTVTLSDYAGWENTSFFVETGLTIWKVMDANVASVDGKKMSVRSALGSQKYDKIYIMLGINELGRGTPDSFCEQFKEVVNEIRSLQPQAIIYIESIMHVTQSKDDERHYINNGEINARNEKIQTIADGINTFWIDENEVFDAPGTGKLNPEYTSDGVHLKPMYISVWQDFLLNHVIIR